MRGEIMFLHVGGDFVVPTDNIIAIIDANLVEIAPVTREFIELAKSEKKITDITNGNPKSYVLTNEKIIASPISSLTLQKRGNFLNSLEKEPLY